MVQLVFVHGVSNRSGAGPSRDITMRDALFTNAAFVDAARLEIENPFWGDDTVKLAWKGLSISGSDTVVESFSLAPEGASAVLPPLAYRQLNEVVDAILSALVLETERQGGRLNDAELAVFRAAGAYAADNPTPAWFHPGLSDAEVVNRLADAVENGEGAIWNATPLDADPAAAQWIETNWDVEPIADQRLVKATVPETARTKLGTWIGATRSLSSVDNTERLRKLAVPTLVLWGTQDVFFPYDPDQKGVIDSLSKAASDLASIPARSRGKKTAQPQCRS